jgi:hypothetical protein
VANARGATPVSPAPSKPDLTAPAPSSLATAPAVPAPRPKEKRRIYTWIAAGVAAVAVGAGAYYGSSAQKKSDDLLGGVHTSEEATALARDADDAAKKANVLYGVGAAAAAAGVTLFFVEGRF